MNELWECSRCPFETDRDSFRIVHEEMNEGHEMCPVASTSSSSEATDE